MNWRLFVWPKMCACRNAVYNLNMGMKYNEINDRSGWEEKKLLLAAIFLSCFNNERVLGETSRDLPTSFLRKMHRITSSNEESAERTELVKTVKNR